MNVCKNSAVFLGLTLGLAAGFFLGTNIIIELDNTIIYRLNHESYCPGIE